MANEKTVVLNSEKIPFSNEQRTDKTCSRSLLSCLFGALLVALLLAISIQFLCPIMEQRSKSEENIHIFQEQPFEAIPPPFATDYTSQPKHKDTRPTPWEWEFLIDPSHLCETRYPPESEEYLQDPEVKLLILVTSATGHFQQRAAIRKTWGSVAEKPFGPMRLGFVLGTTTNQSEERLIQEESSQYKDIIQADFVDSYRNLTIKSVLMLKWVSRRCSHAKYFLKADDDTFVNVGVIASILSNEPFASGDKFIGGYIHKEAVPVKHQDQKYYGSEYSYSVDVYPPYASGAAYVMNGPTAVQLFEASKRVEPFVPMEDVFVTGLCGEDINAQLIHDSRFTFKNPPSPPSWKSFSELATAHSVTPDIQTLVWDEMNRFIVDHLYQLEKAINATGINFGKK